MKTIVFNEGEIQLITAIVLDKDKEQALRFLTDVIWKGSKTKSREHVVRKQSKEWFCPTPN